MKVVVTGIGLASALGTTLTTSWENLLRGHCGIRQYQPFAELEPRPLALLNPQPSHLNAIAEPVIAAALQDAGLAPPLPDYGVVIGSSRGYQAQWEQLAREWIISDRPYAHNGKVDPNLLSPALSEQDPVDSLAAALYSRPLAVVIAQALGSQGPVLAPMAACATGIWAIAQGYELIQSGQCQRVIAGAIEAPITPLTLAGFTKMGALASTGVYPFDRDRQGLGLGEGGALLVLEAATLAQARAARIYGQILGFGATVDAHHVSTPDPNRQAAIAAVQQCLTRSGLTPKEIGYVHAHGTATQLNDQAEAQLLQTLFPQGVPVSSTKGATGHTLGAAGALGAAFTLKALEQKLLPPCVGLQQSAFDLDFVQAARSKPLQTALCFSFGFGGQNAVLALGTQDS